MISTSLHSHTDSKTAKLTYSRKLLQQCHCHCTAGFGQCAWSHSLPMLKTNDGKLTSVTWPPIPLQNSYHQKFCWVAASPKTGFLKKGNQSVRPLTWPSACNLPLQLLWPLALLLLQLLLQHLSFPYPWPLLKASNC